MIDSIKNQPLYSVHPAAAMMQAIVRNLPEKTGRSLDEWILLVEKWLFFYFISFLAAALA